MEKKHVVGERMQCSGHLSSEPLLTYGWLLWNYFGIVGCPHWWHWQESFTGPHHCSYADWL